MTNAARPMAAISTARGVGREVLVQEGQAILALAVRLDGAFDRAVELLLHCPGSVIVSGMGKAGLVGQKAAATLASTGTRSHFLHPAEAVHGDLGRVHEQDVLLLLSQSGETEEVIQLQQIARQWRLATIAITGNRSSRLARGADVTLWLGEIEEAGPLRLAPSTSTTAMLALGDAMALAVSQQRGFTPRDFARYHPGGALGRRLARVEEVMRPLEACRVATEHASIREILVSQERPGRRSGAILLLDDAQRLVGIFTDSDLARLLARQQDQLLDQPILHVMTKSPTTVPCGTMMADALSLIRQRKISELPVVDAQHRPIGLIDITDIVGHQPTCTSSESSDQDAWIVPLPNRTPE